MVKQYVLILLVLLLAGCAKVIMFYPINKTDFFRIENRTTVITPTGNITTEKSGWFMSDFYLTAVAGVKKVK